jgi:preprotein translocase subunit SecE
MQRERQGGFRRFVLESVGELRKVDWPTQKHLVSAVLAVIVACVVVGVFLYVADEALSRFVRDVLLRG